MELLVQVVVVVGLVVVAVLVFNMITRRVTIFEYEKGLKYKKGRFIKILRPGQYWYMPLSSTVEKLDIRPRFISISGQELLSSDAITIKVSVVANFEIIDPDRAVNKIKDYEQALYLEIQLALREIIGVSDIDTILVTRNEISEKLMEMTQPKAEKLGLHLIDVGIKDIMLPGKLKEIFAQVINARLEGIAALEKARGETAALRNLANAAKMIEGNPSLLQLRLIQTVNDTSGNTIVFGLSEQTTLIPKTKNV